MCIFCCAYNYELAGSILNHGPAAVLLQSSNFGDFPHRRHSILFHLLTALYRLSVTAILSTLGAFLANFLVCPSQSHWINLRYFPVAVAFLMTCMTVLWSFRFWHPWRSLKHDLALNHLDRQRSTRSPLDHFQFFFSSKHKGGFSDSLPSMKSM